MSAYFVIGTGTNVGKTYVTASLAHQNKNILALKPIISGYSDSEDTDTHILMKSQGLTNPDAISPWRFAAPLSPDAAAKREGKEIIFSEVVEWCRSKTSAHDGITLIEGAGGVMSPATARHTMLDLADALQLPVLLVAGSYLGTISHTLTAVTALKMRGVSIHKIIISESEISPMPLEETVETIERFCGVELAIIYRNKDIQFPLFEK
jgi:dethiobiotin synthetase